ncbi:MAG TPA: DUF3108 domain-containing protein [Bryobacteraceae bacterium]|jgi:hypothetical protein
MHFSRFLSLRIAVALIAALLAASIPLPVEAQSSPGSSNPGILPAKETLDYDIEWRLGTAGHAKLEWYATTPRIHMGYESKLHLESAGLVSRLYKVSDLYTVEMTPTLCAESTVMTSHEGSRNRETRVNYNSAARKANYVERDLTKNTIFSQKEIQIPGCVYDVLGGLFALRAIRLEPGHATEFHMSDGKKSVAAKVEAEKREEIKTDAGTFKTVRYQAYLFNDVLFRRSAHLYIWLSDDNRKMPVQIQIRLAIAIGTITFKLAKEEK